MRRFKEDPNVNHADLHIDLLAVASRRYWSDAYELDAAVRTLTEELNKMLQSASMPAMTFQLITSEDDVSRSEVSTPAETTLLVPVSGGVQRLLQRLGSRYRRIGLLNAYLPDADFPEALALRMLEMNAHPAATDFWVFQKRTGGEIYWLSNLREALDFIIAAQAVMRLRRSRLLLIGETESWVLNSCREPEVFKRRLGVELVTVPLEELTKASPSSASDEVNRIYQQIRPAMRLAVGISESDIRASCALAAGLTALLDKFDADGFALGCFAMMPLVKTTACLALAYFNGLTPYIGACEGDLDAAVTLRLVKNLGAKHAWMGNPIIFADNAVQLAHCTASWRWGDVDLPMEVKRHHESGIGASPSVTLPEGRSVVLTRIGGDLSEMLIVPGLTQPAALLPTCRTQQRIRIASSKRLLSSLTGTHLIAVNGETREALRFAGRILDLKITGEGDGF